MYRPTLVYYDRSLLSRACRHTMVQAKVQRCATKGVAARESSPQIWALAAVGDLGLGRLEPEHWADRWLGPEVFAHFQAVSDDEKASWRQITGLLVGHLPDGPDLVAKNLPVMSSSRHFSRGTAVPWCCTWRTPPARWTSPQECL